MVEVPGVARSGGCRNAVTACLVAMLMPTTFAEVGNSSADGVAVSDDAVGAVGPAGATSIVATTRLVAGTGAGDGAALVIGDHTA